MVRKLLFSALVFFAGLDTVLSQGSIKGKVIDASTKEPLPFANVIVEKGGIQAGGATTDFDGNFEIKPLSPGNYDLKATFVGYQPVLIANVQVNEGRMTPQTVSMTQGVELKAFERIEYSNPLIDADNTVSGGTVTREEIAKMPGRSAESVAISVGGIYSSDGERGSVRGSRSDATDTYIDGIKVRGSSNIPNSAIDQISVILGGLPAQYGDATGGIISITTRGPSNQYFGGVEGVTSEFLDPYGYNLIGGNISGPLMTRPDPLDSSRRKPVLGFFLSGEARYERDPDPSAIGSWKVNDATLHQLEADPLRASGSGAGAFKNADFIRTGDLERTDYRLNVASRGIVVQGKVDYATSANTNVTVGGTYNYTHRKDAGVATWNNTLFNYANNPDIYNNDWRAYARFTQRLTGSDPIGEEKSLIRNAYYSLQADYSKETEKVWDARHQDNIFHYGYLGRFTSYYANSYEYVENGPNGQGYYHNGFNQYAFTYEPGNINPELAAYTQRYYNLYDDPTGNYENPFQVEQGGGLLNGQLPTSVYGLWTAPGVPYNRYSKFNGSTFRIRATGSATVKNHELLLGFEYEQRTDRSYILNPVGLWDRAFRLQNFHIQELDTANPHIEYQSTYPTITYDRLYGDDQGYFDYNLRKSLGLDPLGTDYLDVFSYDPEQLDISYFSADELLVNGFRSSFVSYYGYDHTGQKTSGRPSIDDFFNEKDEFGNFKREVAPFEPIYMAGYLQDKFSFRDLIFNVGVRVDRFDANQPVLKDEYSFFETVKAGEIGQDHPWIAAGNQIPSNIDDDFVVYVSDIDNPGNSAIVGFRDGSTWYSAEGNIVSDPRVLYTSNGIAPYLVDPTKRNSATDLTSAAFEDYQPQVIVMPRIAFSFPISDEANLFAHYDILSQRPRTGIRMDPLDYLFIGSSGNEVINNPKLRPEKTIDYELGFEQRVSNSSAIKLFTFYREMRDMIAVNYIQGAYPKDYITYSNQDFGTVKGLTVSYDLRRTGNVSLRASYTLQYADGTGSTATTGLNLVTTGQQSLRTIFPLNFDQRHAIVGTLDYRYGAGKDYNGPKIKGAQILANTGLNLLFRVGSGTPYTANTNVTLQADDVGDRGQLNGGINSARLPWQFGTDIRLDRDFVLEWGSEDNKRKRINLNAYFLFLNALNTLNIVRVYPATGNPDDDGYLASAIFAPAIETQNDPQAYRDQYNVKVNDPDNYSMPRRIRLGLIMNF